MEQFLGHVFMFTQLYANVDETLGTWNTWPHIRFHSCVHLKCSLRIEGRPTSGLKTAFADSGAAAFF